MAEREAEGPNGEFETVGEKVLECLFILICCEFYSRLIG